MPVLSTDRQTTKIILPSSVPNDEAWVTVYEAILAGDVVGLELEGAADKSAVFKTLAIIIQDWNFVDKEGKKVPVSEESVRLMQMIDVMAIMDKTKVFDKLSQLPDVKKKLSSYSSPQSKTEVKDAK